MKDFGSKLLGDIVFARTYAQTKPNGRKETYQETVNRVADMHVRKYPHLEQEIRSQFELVHSRQAVPSMRSMQFAGSAIEKTNEKIYNCSFVAVTNFKDVADMAFLSMNGVGCGYSVQSHHVEQLPVITSNFTDEVFVVPDSREGWADSFVAILSNPETVFDYTQIRKKGAKLSSGGSASGPEALITAHNRIRDILDKAVGRKLIPIEVHDIVCHVADAVVCGGVRRSALIVIFDCNDEAMLSCKAGNWWEQNPQRGRANNSAILLRDSATFEPDFRRILQACKDSNAGEPGIFLSNSRELGVNPCVEISLENGQLCNLTEVNVANCFTKQDFMAAVTAATIIGTLQASYTDFTYVQPKFKENCERDALLGVSLTGQADNWGMLSDENLQEASALMVKVNGEWAAKLGINPAARIGCVKPSGSTSALLGSSSGIHAAHAEKYLRRIRLDVTDPIAIYLMREFGVKGASTNSVVEQEAYNHENVVVTVPVTKYGAIVRDNESSVDLLNRSKHITDHWIKPSHRYGSNCHNVSLTVSYKPEEWDDIVAWMYTNRESYTGISLLPFSGGSYAQLPFESVSDEMHEEWCSRFTKPIDLTLINFKGRSDERIGELACSGTSCEIK